MRTLFRLLRSHFIPAATVCVAFAIASCGQTLSTLVNFDGTNGANAGESLVQSTDGELYGTTTGGGINDPNCYPDGCGTLFKIAQDGNLTTLHEFDVSDGFQPIGLLQASNGNFYGTTHSGGLNNAGTVFELTADGTFTTLYSFCSQGGCSDGQNPSSALIQGADGNLYGTTVFGGAHGPGTIFRITTTGALLPFSIASPVLTVPNRSQAWCRLLTAVSMALLTWVEVVEVGRFSNLVQAVR